MNHNAFASPFHGQALLGTIQNPNISVGEYTYYSGYYHGMPFEHCVRYLRPDRTDVDKLVIGKYCSIGSGAAFIMAGNQGHRHDWISTFPFYYVPEDFPEGARDGYKPYGDTVIGHDVWIGSEAMILPGVKVGHGAVLAARAVVTKDVAPYTIVGGNPAREIRKRFSDDEIELLLRIQWWDWDRERVAQALPLLTAGDVRALAQFSGL